MTQAMWGRLLQEVENMEERLETMKLSGSPLVSPAVTVNIVQHTSGLLGKHFPSGKIYQKKVRASWIKNSRARTIWPRSLDAAIPRTSPTR